MCKYEGCGKAFSNASDCAKHMNRTHSDEVFKISHEGRELLARSMQDTAVNFVHACMYIRVAKTARMKKLHSCFKIIMCMHDLS